ncbi:hypothetical protein BEH94_06140 [Candidatus Altiarchaeales archaeon WOR_SM1_SCG]|nr:hypothetical protein BEH94_06140 [Candidatus Altiarchaeales archaeon WOR_SM1_SCG]
MTRRRPKQHFRRSYTRRDGTQVVSTTVNKGRFYPAMFQVKPTITPQIRDHQAEINESENKSYKKMRERFEERIKMTRPKDEVKVPDEPLKIAWKITSIVGNTAFNYAFPQVAIPARAGYVLISKPEKIENLRKITDITSDDSKKLMEAKNALNETVKDVAKATIKSTIKYASGYVVQELVDNSSGYLEKKQVFKEITESFRLDESYTKYFKDFYEKSLSGCLNEIKNRGMNYA